MSRLIDWKTMCLVCLKKDENRSIFNRDSDSNVIVDKIIKCADIFIEKDTNQPKSICLQCLDNLNVTYKFYRNYEQSDSIIQGLLSTNHQGFEINDLWKTTQISVNATHDICIKNEIVDEFGVDGPYSDNGTTCLNSKDEPGTDARIVTENRSNACVPNDIELNHVKANKCNKTKQEGNNEISTRVRGQSKSLTEVFCTKSSLKSACKRNPKICEICNRTCRGQGELDIHIRRHNDDRPFSCDDCDKAFVTSTELRRHVVLHTGQKPFKCQYCDHRFLDSHNRKNHERIHTDERPYVCPTCDKSFRYSYALTRHRRIHTGVTKFVSKNCDEGLSKNVPFEKHPILQLAQDNAAVDGRDTEAEFVVDRAGGCVESSAMELNNVKANESNKIKQESNNKNVRPLRDQSKSLTEVSRAKLSLKSTCKRTLKICKICNRSCKSQGELNIHMRRHNNERPYSCDHCEKAFVTPTELRRHTLMHTGEKPFKCQYCDRGFLDSHNRKNHERIHTDERPYVCPTCGKSFRYSYALTQHLPIHTGIKKFVCKECGKGFDTRVLHKIHVALHLTEDELDKSPEHKQKNPENKEVLKMKKCSNPDEINVKHEIADNAVVDDPDTVEDHVEVSVQSNVMETNNVKGNESNKTKQETDNEISKVKGQSKSLIEVSCAKPSLKSAGKRTLKICELCNRTCRGQGELDIHMRRHKDERPYSCDHCDKAFVTMTCLRRHARRHTGEKPFTCKHCGRGFVDSHAKKNHELIHTDEWPYICQKCGKRFRTCYRLTQHFQVHIGVKKFTVACVQSNGMELNCDKTLESHKIKQDANDEVSIRPSSQSEISIQESSEKPRLNPTYKSPLKICEICKQSFSSQRKLDIHMRSHTEERPFRCDHCEKAFVAEAELECHVRVHTGQRSYKCQYCDRRFSGYSVKKNHESTHTGERPYVCSTCGKSFATYSGGLRRHLLIHKRQEMYMQKMRQRSHEQDGNHVVRHMAQEELDKSSEHKQKKILEKEIFQIEECANSNEISIKHEVRLIEEEIN